MTVIVNDETNEPYVDEGLVSVELDGEAGDIPADWKSRDLPVEIKVWEPRKKGAHYWAFRDDAYVTTEALTGQEVKALALKDENRIRAKLAAAVVLMDRVEQLTEHGRREVIPDDVKMFVWQRDNGACVTCGSRSSLEFDHIIPLSMGGSNTARNLQLLCESCNRSKGASLV